MIVAIGGTKGGTGKSTIATHLAVLFAARGPGVLLVDADPQQTSLGFTNVRAAERGEAGYACVPLSGRAVAPGLRRLVPAYRDVVIDTASNDPAAQRAALGLCDVYLVPFAPRSFDVWTLGKVAGLIGEARQANPSLRALAFLNRADPIGADNSSAAEILQTGDHLRFIAPTLGNRKSFARAATSGLSVTELRPKDLKAIDEIEALFAEISKQP